MVAFAVGPSGRSGGFLNGTRKTILKGATPLLYACQQCDLHTIKKIIDRDPSAVRQRDRSGKTALHYCTTSDGPAAAQAADLLAMAAPELVDAKDEDGFTPLHLAVIAGNMPLVTFLLANGADVEAVDAEKHSVVHWATVCGETVALRAVLAAGSPVSTPDVHGGYPLHYAAQMCGGEKDSALGLQVLHTLLSHNGVVVTVEDGDGRQPLLWAASAGSAKAVLALVRAGATAESSDKDGLTALHCAASRGHTDCLDTLLTLCGAHPDVIDSNGCTSLHYAVTLGHADATSLLLAHGADPDRQDRKGRTPAHCGCAKGQFETVKMLAGRGANLWLKNARGDFPLHEAAASGRRELVRWLLEARPSQVNARNNDGRCPIHLAALNDNADMCKVLLDSGALVNPVLRTTKNVMMTPLDCALQRGFRSTAKFLQCHGGVPANRLGGVRTQNSILNSAVSLQIRDDVTFFGDTTSESEMDKDEKTHKKGHKKRFGSKQKKDVGDNPDDLTQNEVKTASTMKYGKGKFELETKNTENALETPRSKMNVLNYTSEITVVDRGDSVGIQHSHNGEIVFKKDENEVEDLPIRAKTKEDTPDPRRKEFIDDGRTKRQLLVELRKELINNENKSTQYSLDADEPPESSSKAIEKKVKSVTVKTETTTTLPERVSLTSCEDNNETTSKIVVEASVHAPPKQDGSTKTPRESPKQKESPKKEVEIIETTEKETSECKNGTTKETKFKEVTKTTEVEITENGEDNTDDDDDSDKTSKVKVVTVEKTTETTTEEVKCGRRSSQLNSPDKTDKDDGPESGRQSKQDEIQQLKEEIDKKVAEMVQKATELATIDTPRSQSEKSNKIDETSSKDTGKTVVEIEGVKGEEASTSREIESLKEDESQGTHNTIRDDALGRMETEIKTERKTLERSSKTVSSSLEPTPRSDEQRTKPKKARRSDETVRIVEFEDSSLKVSKKKTVKSKNKKEKPPSAFENAKEYDKRRREEAKRQRERRHGEESESTEESGVQQDMQDSVTESERVEVEIRIPSKKIERFLETTEDETTGDRPIRKETQKHNLIKVDSLMLGRRKMRNRSSDSEDANKSDDDLTYSSTEDSIANKSHKSFTVIGPRQDVDKLPSMSPRKTRSKSEENRKDAEKFKKSRIPTSITLRRTYSKSEKDLDKHRMVYSSQETRIPSLPNLVGDGSTRRRRPRSESNIPVPYKVVYSEYEVGSGTDNEEVTESAKRRRWKKRSKRGKSAGSGYESNVIDSGFEPSPRSVKQPGKWRKMSEKGVNMSSVQQTIQNNIRRYHLERKIFQHLLDLKRLQIRSGQHNETVLVKRAIEDYHKSCTSTVGAGRYNSDDFTFKGFEHFLYHALRKLQKNGVEHLKGLPAAPDNPLFCTQSTHRCLHATHAYTGIPCAAYLPKMDHHTIPKIGFDCKPQGFLPHIGSKKSVTLELSHGADKQVISLPADRLDQNKRYYVTFTVKGHDKKPVEGHRHPRSD